MIIPLSQPPLHCMPRKRKDLGKGKREAIYKQISSPTRNNKTEQHHKQCELLHCNVFPVHQLMNKKSYSFYLMTASLNIAPKRILEKCIKNHHPLTCKYNFESKDLQ